MDINSYLLPAIIALSIITVSSVFFSRIGVGTIVGFIVAGIILGPNTPGPIATTNIETLQSIADFGVVLFLFTLGLEMKPQQLWSMKKTILVQGFGQVILTAVIFSAIGTFIGLAWEVGFVIGIIFSQSSTAVVMSLLQERKQLSTPHGNNIFANLMAQDISVVPIMALIPILAHQHSANEHSALDTAMMVISLMVCVFILARYILPFCLKVSISSRNKSAFSLSLFVVILLTLWLSSVAGVSQTLGAFILGMLLSTSDFRLMLEEVVSPLKQALMALFFLSVGMAINPAVFFSDFGSILFWLAAAVIVKTSVFILLAFVDGKGLSVSIKTGFNLSQVGELAFVLLGIATAAGILDSHNAAVGFIIISISMIMTPLMNKQGDWIVKKYLAGKDGPDEHVFPNKLVILGLDEVGRLIALLADRSGIPYAAYDIDYECVQKAKKIGLNAHFGDILNSGIQQKSQLKTADAAFISVTSSDRLKRIALMLSHYNNLDIYARANSRTDEFHLREQGVQYASSIYIESTFLRGSELLRNFGVSEKDTMSLIDKLKQEIFEQDYHQFEQQKLSTDDTDSSQSKSKI
ncbi:cation:proton antiporter [Shewanella sp. UCD-KL21]|uniref:cation:proton antiporter domain-containing protein n=1 Tax=Shewanella sp. UCD-KL21 TaxID=1917164 RepID=UPI00097148C0|nr:cation:proton antiporter [Shewanella sp. UCD-KL21]